MSTCQNNKRHARFIESKQNKNSTYCSISIICFRLIYERNANESKVVTRLFKVMLAYRNRQQLK